MRKWVAVMLVLAPSLAWAQTPPVQVATKVMQNAAVATGNGSAIDVSSANILVMQVTISATATVTYEASLDNTNWTALPCAALGGTSQASTISASGMVRCNVTGISLVRARISSYGSGTVTVTGVANLAPNSWGVAN